MKKQFNILVLLALTSLPTFTFAQSRTAGKLVVPCGYEQYDSVRFTLVGMEQGRGAISYALTNGGPWLAALPFANTMMNLYGDSLQATFEAQFGSITDTSLIAGKRKGVFSWMTATPVPFSVISWLYKARTFYPQPSGSEDFSSGNGNFWRYNDLNFNSLASWHNNSYDTNDISPYCEYPKNDSFVHLKYLTAKFGGADSVYYGNEGRVILGYSDNRAADQLLKVHPNEVFHTGAIADVPQAFSVNLDFNIDVSSIDTALNSGRTDSLLPLLTLQVLYKDGIDVYYPSGQAVLPFVPFRDSAAF